jgi:HEAT repeat protein
MKTNRDVDAGSPESKRITSIIQRLVGDEKLRHNALVALEKITPGEAPLFKRAWRTIPPPRRREIAQRLVELTEDNAELTFTSVFRALLKDDDAEVRASAVEGLWEDGDTALVAIFIGMMEQDNAENVQAAAAAALGQFALRAECGQLREEYSATISRALLAVIDNREKPLTVRRRALEAVAVFSLPQVGEAIKAAYVSGNHDYKMSALFAMGRHCDTVFLPILTVELSSTDTETRYEAASALGEMGEETAVAHLEELLSDTDADVRLTAIRSLGEIGGARAKKTLQKCLDSPDEAVAAMAEEALAELEDGEDPLDI